MKNEAKAHGTVRAELSGQYFHKETDMVLSNSVAEVILKRNGADDPAGDDRGGLSGKGGQSGGGQNDSSSSSGLCSNTVAL